VRFEYAPPVRHRQVKHTVPLQHPPDFGQMMLLILARPDMFDDMAVENGIERIVSEGKIRPVDQTKIQTCRR